MRRRASSAVSAPSAAYCSRRSEVTRLQLRFSSSSTTSTRTTRGAPVSPPETACAMLVAFSLRCEGASRHLIETFFGEDFDQWEGDGDERASPRRARHAQPRLMLADDA